MYQKAKLVEKSYKMYHMTRRMLYYSATDK